MDDKTYTFRQWMTPVPFLVGIAIVAAEVIHVSFRIGWDQLFGALLALVGIQVSLYISMFWIRKRALVTRDLRLGVVASGCYLLAFMLTLDHYLLRWKIISTNRLPDDLVLIPIGTAVAVVVFSLWRRRHPATRVRR